MMSNGCKSSVIDKRAFLSKFPAWEGSLKLGAWLYPTWRDPLKDPCTIDEIFQFLIYRLFL